MSVSTETVYDAALITEARAAFNRARSLYPDWPDSDRGIIGESVRSLAEALVRYDRLRCGIVPAFFPGMPAGPGALAKCLQGAAEDAQEVADILVHQFPACGAEGSEQS